MNQRIASYETLITPELSDAVRTVRERWQNDQEYTFSNVKRMAESTGTLEPGTYNSRAYIVEPDGDHTDEEHTVVLALPHLNGWTPHHFIRTKVAQQIVAPNSRFIVLPNNSLGQTNYDLSLMTDKERDLLGRGSLRPIAERHIRTLELLSESMPLGAIALSGYSLGASMVLNMGTTGSDKLNVTHINADEAPSKPRRTAGELRKDFTAGGITPLRRAVSESEIPALSKAMNAGRMAIDLGRFGIASMGRDAKLIQEAMASTVGLTLFSLKQHSSGPNGLYTKVGYVEGSPIFDPESITPTGASAIDLVKYGGEGFYGHASGDNVITHALLVNDGINPKN